MRICAPQDKFSASTSCTKRPHIGPTPIDYFQFGIGFVRLHLFHDGFFVLHTTNVFVFFSTHDDEDENGPGRRRKKYDTFNPGDGFGTFDIV